MQAKRNAPDPRKLVRTKTPGIFKRGSSYVVTYRKPNGGRGKKFVRTYAEAKTLRASLTADVHRGEYRETTRAAFDDYAREWIDTYRGRTRHGIRPETLAEYRRQIERRAIPHFGRVPLAAIDPPAVRRFVAAVEAEGVRPNTVRLALAPVKALFATAVADGAIRTNPATGVHVGVAPLGDEREERVKALTLEELRGLLAEVDPAHRLLVEFLAVTGFRISEAVGLRWQDVPSLLHAHPAAGQVDARAGWIRRSLGMAVVMCRSRPRSRSSLGHSGGSGGRVGRRSCFRSTRAPGIGL